MLSPGGDALPGFKQRNKLNLQYFSAVKKSSVEVPDTFLMTEYGRNEKDLINCNTIVRNEKLLDSFAVDADGSSTCSCGKPYKVGCSTGKKGNRYNSKPFRHLLAADDGPELNDNGVRHKLLDLSYKLMPLEKFFQDNKFNECCVQVPQTEVYVLLKLKEDNVPDSQEPYALVRKQIYCLDQKSRRKESDGDVYTKINTPAEMEKAKPDVEESPETNDGNVEGTSEVKKPEPPPRKTEKNATAGDIQPVSLEEPYDESDQKKGLYVREMKYYEGSLNIFGMQDGKDSSNYLKITKTVMIEKNKGETDKENKNKDEDREENDKAEKEKTERDGGENKSLGKTLGIDSWVQTEDNKESYANISRNNGVNQVALSSRESDFQSAKVCCDCIRTIANDKLQRRDPKSALLDKSTSMDKTRKSLQVSGDEFTKFIVDLFLEAIPKELYNRMLGDTSTSPSREEEFKVHVKSFDKNSTDSCNLETCKMRNISKDARQSIHWKEKSEAPISEGDCLNSKASITPNSSKPGMMNEKDDEEDTYDCQITVNGRKILIKVNKSVENLLLSGNVQNVVHCTTSEEMNGKTSQNNPLCENTENEFNKFAGNCRCYDQGKDKDSVAVKGKRGSSTLEASKNLKKYYSDPSKQQGQKNSKSVKTSPQDNGSLRYENQNNIKRNLYWCNIDMTDKRSEAEKNISKANGYEYKGAKDFKCKTNDLGGLNRTKRYEYPYKMCINRPRQFDVEKKKEQAIKLEEGVYPLYWESDYAKYCGNVVTKERGMDKGDNYQSGVKGSRNRNIVHEIEKRMVVTPANLDHDETPQLCIIKISENDKCTRLNDSRDYRNYTVANFASMELNSNIFDADQITCRKCIETLKSLDANLTEGKEYKYQNSEFCNYYWNNLESQQNDDTLSGRTPEKNLELSEKFHAVPDCCILNACYQNEDNINPESDKCDFPTESNLIHLSSKTLYGISFNISRVKTSQGTSSERITPLLSTYSQCTSVNKRDAGVLTNMQYSSKGTEFVEIEKKVSCTQTDVQKRRSSISFTRFKVSSKSSLKKEKSALKVDSAITPRPSLNDTCLTSFESDRKSMYSQDTKDSDLVTHSLFSMEEQTEGIKVQAVPEKRLRSNKWRWWRRNATND